MMRATLLMVALAAVVPLGCARAPGSRSGRPVVRFAYDLWAGYYPVLIASHLGYFEAEGIEVQAIHPEHTDPMMSEFAAGRYDAIAVALGDVLAIAQAHPGVRVVLKTDESAGGDAVVARPEIPDVRGLRGRRVAVNLGSFGELFVRRMLEANGLTAGDVRFVDADAAQAPAMLREGRVDAAHTWEPYVSQAVREGGHVLFSSAQTPGLIPDVVAFRDEFVVRHPDAVRGFVKAWLRGVDWWLAHPDSGQRIVATMLGNDSLDTSTRGLRLMTLEDNRRVFSDSAEGSLRRVARRYLDFYEEVGSVRTPPDLEHLVDPGFLPR